MDFGFPTKIFMIGKRVFLVKNFYGIGKCQSCIFGCDPNMQVTRISTTHIDQPTFIPLTCACVIECVTKICKFFILQIVFFRQGSSINCFAKIVPSY